MVITCTGLAVAARGPRTDRRRGPRRPAGPCHSARAVALPSALKNARAWIRSSAAYASGAPRRSHTASSHSARSTRSRVASASSRIVRIRVSRATSASSHRASRCASNSDSQMSCDIAARGKLGEREKREPAPRRAEHGEPGGAIAQVMQGLQQRHEIANDRDIPQGHEIHADGIDADRIQRRHDRRRVGARQRRG